MGETQDVHDAIMQASLDADREKLISLGQDAGLTMEELADTMEAVANGSSFKGERIETVTLTVSELAQRDMDNFWGGYAFAALTAAEALKGAMDAAKTVTLDTQVR